MRGDFPDVAQRQIEIIHFAKQVSSAQKIIMCPTYYSYEPILEHLFGKRPSDYWQELGTGLDTDIEIFWTGEKVCSTAYSLDHISEINDELKRHVSLWDNYPVNDGKNTSPYLHLKGFENRPSSLAGKISRHAINPMNAAHLSKIAILTLIDSYRLGNQYDAITSQKKAIEALCEPKLAEQIKKIHLFFSNLDYINYQLKSVKI
jgi:beta-N-acetylglucosaminidase.